VTALVAGLLALLPLWEGGATPFGIFLTQSLVFALLAWALVSGLRKGSVALASGWESVAALALLAVCLLSFLRVDYLFGSFLAIWDLVVAIALAGAMALWTTAARGTRGESSAGAVWAAVLAASCAAQAVTALVQAAPANMTPSGAFANANQLAAYLDLGAFVALGRGADLIRTRRWTAAGAYFVAAGACIAALVRVGARGALAALLAVSAFWIAMSIPRARRRLRIALFGALAVLAVVAVAAVAIRFERTGDPYRFERIGIWRASLRAGLDHPLLGMGPGMFERRAYQYNFPLEQEMFRYSKQLGSTHSTYLRAWAESGLLGLTATLLLIALILCPLVRRCRASLASGDAPGRAIGPTAALMAGLVHGLVDTPFEVPAVTLSLIVLVVPLMAPAGPSAAPLFAAAPAAALPRRRIVAATAMGAVALGWIAGVAWPYAAHLCFEEALRGGPSGGARAIARAIGLNPYNPLYLATRAEMRSRPGTRLELPAYAASDLDLWEANRLDPGNPEHLLERAQLHARACFDLGADAVAADRTIALYREAIDLGGKDPRPHMELAGFLLALGRLEAGLREIEAALELEPRFLGARLTLARVLIEMGRREDAGMELERLRRIRDELASYDPRNGYEKDLMRLEESALREVADRLK
jgi:tetratricopeptide (TPR) repeat protein